MIFFCSKFTIPRHLFASLEAPLGYQVQDTEWVQDDRTLYLKTIVINIRQCRGVAGRDA